MSKFCTSCGQQLSDTAGFCSACGREQIVSESFNSASAAYNQNTSIPVHTFNENSRFVNQGHERADSISGGVITSFILGIIGMAAWIIPIIGAPVTIVGLVFGIQGNKRRRSGLAIAGIILSIIGLFATVVNSSIGAYKGATGTLFQHKSEVVFCEKVDSKLHPINPGTTFSTEEFYVTLTTAAPFHTTEINLTIYKENGASESVVIDTDRTVNQDWSILAVPLTLNTPGKYKVTFSRTSDGVKLGEGIVTIK
ncbi:MAG: zinc-ribbon domain-containing protein [Bacillota bacterium]|nr:zinc-ribbon domain-containing protein [Bacillota bacterium]